MTGTGDKQGSEETPSPGGAALNEAAFHAIPFPLALLDPDFNFILVNRVCATAMSMPRGHLPGENFFALFPDPEREAAFRRARDTGVEISARAGSFSRADSPDRPATRWDWTLTPVITAGRVTRLMLALRDVTHEMSGAEELARSEARLVDAQRIAHIGSWELDLVRNRLEWSAEIYRIFEIDPRRFGASYEAFLAAIHPDDRDAVNAAYTQSLERRTPYEITHRLLMPDGRVKWVAERCESEFDADGRPLRSVGTVQDVTDRVAVDEALRSSKKRLRDILDSLFGFVGLYTLDGVLVDANRAPLEAAGLRREDVLGLPFWDTYWWNHDTAIQARLRDALQRAARGEVVRYETEVRVKDDRRIVIDVNFGPLRDMAGAITNIVGFGVDITERVAAERELRRINESLEERIAERTRELRAERNFIATVLDIAGGLFVVLDRRGRIVRFNRTCERLTGFRFEELRDRPIWEYVIPPDQRDAVRGVFERLATTALPSTYENDWLRKDGSRFPVTWSNATLTGEDGSLAYVVATGIDISDRKRAETALLVAKEEADRANAAKSEFLARMSHELRTPLNSILGFAQLLDGFSEPPLSGTDRESVREILFAGEHLLHLINDILDLSRIDAGQFSIKFEEFSIDGPIRAVWSLTRPLADGKSVTLHQDLGNPPFPVVRADRVRLKQVLLNLVSNAIKFNRPGGTVNVNCARGEHGTLRIKVADSGPGLTPTQIQRLFVPFERLDADRHAIDGTGIGLALSRKLVELMQGEIGVDSIPGTGSTFWITLPLANPTGGSDS